MKVQIQTERIFNVTINGKTYPMKKVNEMAGMVHLKTESGQDLVINKSCNLPDFFDFLSEEQSVVDVIKISPSLTE